MNGPYFRNYTRSVPVQQKQQPKASPKVVSIPVHFVSSHQTQTQTQTQQQTLKNSSAVKIQKVFRGYVVRKSVKKIVTIQNEVNDIEHRINDVEYGSIIRKDAKERLRVNETLMSLLFKLDSIRGFDYGVRELRKFVTKKAIALQDSIPQKETESPVSVDDVSNSFRDHEKARVNADVMEDVEGSMEECNDDVSSVNEAVKDRKGSMEKCGDDVSNEVRDPDNEDVKEVVEDSAKECDDDVSNEVCDMEKGRVNEDVKDQTIIEGCDDDKGKMEVMKKLMCDNEKMMKLMNQISERNEMQTRMINSLSRRVELLEKVFVNDKLRRNKKKTNRREKDHFFFI